MQTSSISFAPHVEIGDSARRIANARARDSCPPRERLLATDISIYAYLRGKKVILVQLFVKKSRRGAVAYLFIGGGTELSGGQ